MQVYHVSLSILLCVSDVLTKQRYVRSPQVLFRKPIKCPYHYALKEACPRLFAKVVLPAHHRGIHTLTAQSLKQT